jgi:hypothetical protein
MPRIRSVHPGLFTDEAFMELTVGNPLAGLLLIGLWTEADDSGSFEWKLLTLKARLLPATVANIGELLGALAALRFIRRFDVGGRAIGVVRNFAVYQRPKEPDDRLPFTDETRKFAGFVGGQRPGRGGAKNETGFIRNEPPSEPGGNRIYPDLPVQVEEEGGGKVKDSPPSCGASADASGEAGARPPESLEARCRRLMGSLPVVVDPDFGPIRRLVEGGLGEADVIAGLEAALATADFRPRSWAKLEGWVRRAAKDRIEAALPPRRSREGPIPLRPNKPRDVRLQAFRNVFDVLEGRSVNA